MVTPDEFKHVMRRWASTVSIITTKHDDVIYGLTATSFASLSAHPPLVFVCLHHQSRTRKLVDASGIFCVNFLAPDLKRASERFAGRAPDEDRWDSLAHRPAKTGAPVLDNAIGYLDCVVEQKFDAGDHAIYIGRVEAAGLNHADQAPLLYFNGKYHKLGEDV